MRIKDLRAPTFLVIIILIMAFSLKPKQVTTLYLIGDSTMADYANNYEEGKDYRKVRYPAAGWGQVFQQFLVKDSLSKLNKWIKTDSVCVIDRARGGRSTRTFFEEGRWRSVYENLKKGDVVMIQFGHNDASKDKPERYVDIEGFKEFLRLFVNQTRQRGAFPVIITPVTRNYPWEEGILKDSHGEYDKAPKEVAHEMNVALIDLNKASRDFFTQKGKDYVTANYYMNLPAGKYEAFPEGLKDDSHFQIAGAVEVSRLVFEALQKIKN